MCCCLVLKLWFLQLCQQCSDRPGHKIYVCVCERQTDRFYPPGAAQVRMNEYKRSSTLHWLICSGVRSDLGKENKEHMSVQVSACEGVGQKKSKNQNGFSHTDLSISHLKAWVSFWMEKAKTKGMGGGNKLSCQVGALHQATGAGGTTVACRMMTVGAWRWWGPCPVWRAFFLSSLLSPSVPHPLCHNIPSPRTTSSPSCELHQISIFLSPWPSRCWPGRIFCKAPTSHDNLLYPKTTWGVLF